MTTTGLEVKLLADSSAFRNAAIVAVDALEQVAATGERIVDPLVGVSEQAAAVADSLRNASESFEKTNVVAESTASVLETAAAASDKFAGSTATIAERFKNAATFIVATEAKTREIAAGFDEAASAARDLAADVGICSRSSGEEIGALNLALGVGLTYAVKTLGKAVQTAFSKKIPFSAAIAQVALTRVKLKALELYSQFALFAAAPGLLAITIGLEASRRATAEAAGGTSKFQDALEEALEAWERWAEALAGPTLDAVAASLSAVASVLETIRDGVEAIERTPFLGGVAKGVESTIGPITVFCGLLALIKTYTAWFFGGSFLAKLMSWTKTIVSTTAAVRSYSVAQALANAQKKISATWDATLIALGLKKAATTTAETSVVSIATAAQHAWNAAKIVAAALTGAGIALVVAAVAAGTAYAASTRSAAVATENYNAATADFDKTATVTKDSYAELSAEIKRSNDEALTPAEAHAKELARIQERADLQKKTAATIAAYGQKEIELQDLLAGAHGRLTREQKKEAIEKLEKLREEKKELEETYDASLEYSEAAQKRDREASRQNALSALGVADLFDQKTATETRDEKLANLQKALDMKLIDDAAYKGAVEKVVAEFEATDEEAKKVADANKKIASILETNAQKAAEVYAVLDEGVVLEEERAALEDALNDELLRATENGKYYADALKANVPFSERLTAELDDLTETVGLLKDGSRTTAEREAALADARAKLTETLLSETETGKFLIDAQRERTSIEKRFADAISEMEANAKAAGMSDETLAAAKEKLTASILQQTEAGKYLLQAEKNLVPKTELLQKAYEEIEASARAAGLSEETVAEAKRLAEEDILGKKDPSPPTAEEKSGSNAAIYAGSTAALDAINARREDKQVPLLKEIATASKKTSAAIETVARKEEPETFNG